MAEEKKEVPRFWNVGHSMGYVGTGDDYQVDLVEDGFYSEEQLQTLSIEEVREFLYEGELETALEKVEAWANPVE